MDQVIKHQKHHPYLHFHAIFLSMRLESATNYNRCENDSYNYKVYCQDLMHFFIYLFYIYKILGNIFIGL